MKWRYERDTQLEREEGYGVRATRKLIFGIYRGPERVGYIYDIAIAGRLVDVMNEVETLISSVRPKPVVTGAGEAREAANGRARRPAAPSE